MIYQPCQRLSFDPIDLKNLASELAKALLPRAEILSAQVESEHAHLLVRDVNALVAFELCRTAVGEETFELALKILNHLESMRRLQNDPLLREVSVYLLAHHFSSNFLKRLSLEGLGIHLFEWCFIHSEELVMGDAHDLGREKFSNGVYIKRLEYSRESPVPKKISPDLSAGLNLRKPSPRTRLTTAELIALASLGLEIRNPEFRNLQISSR